MIMLTAICDQETTAHYKEEYTLSDLDGLIQDVKDGHEDPSVMTEDEWSFLKLVDADGNIYRKFFLPIDFAYLQDGRLYGGHSQFIVDFSSILAFLEETKRLLSGNQDDIPQYATSRWL